MFLTSMPYVHLTNSTVMEERREGGGRKRGRREGERRRGELTETDRNFQVRN